VHIGTSGWSYDDWAGVLYPPGTPPSARLALYAAQFDTVELNASFYHWPSAGTFAGWRERLPDGFQLSVKASRGLTHARRLAEPEAWVERIVAAWGVLGPRAGVLLLQLPPAMPRDDSRLEHVLALLAGRVRVAVELRHPTWQCEDVYRLLERRGAASCVMSGAGLPCVLRATAPFVYVRLHGPDPQRLYAGSYPEHDLRWWADRLREWEAGGRDVYAYFNNDEHGFAVHDARRLLQLVAGDG
jgi:uncharacterized protein YecE (DUF72 family)